MPSSTVQEPRPRVALVSLGCRVNRADTDALAARLAGRCELTGAGEPADLVVVNTCAVTADAEAASRQAVRRAGREQPQARIVASGCYAEVAPDLLRGLPGVVAVVGARAHVSVADLVLRLAAGDEGPAALAIATGGSPPWGPAPLDVHLHARPSLKVQDGCDAHCAYCVVPSVRGASRSLPFEEAVDQLVTLGAHHAEVVLTGVHLGGYGRDLSPARSLAELVETAAARGLTARLRLSSVEPQEFPVSLLRRPATAALLCEHVHLPVQSGSPAVLEAMGRAGGDAAFRRVVAEVAALRPGAAIGADLLVGFPGETAGDHRLTVAMCEALPLAYLHVFPYSSRPGTAAAAKPDQVPPAVVRERTRELLDLSARRWRGFLGSQAGRVVEVVVERVEGGLARGTARNYVGLRWPAGPERRGALVRVRVDGSDGGECYGVRATAFDHRLPP